MLLWKETKGDGGKGTGGRQRREDKKLPKEIVVGIKQNMNLNNSRFTNSPSDIL